MAVTCIVQKSRRSSNVKVKGQRSRSRPGQNKRKVRNFVRESSSGARSSCGIFFGSGPRGRGYAGGKISACCLVMVALWNRADHYIFMLWFLSSIFFPRLISAAAHWMSTILLPHTVWPQCEFGMHVRNVRHAAR